MPTHEWKETTDEGARRIVRANKRGRSWSLQSRLKGDEFWTSHDPIPLADLHSLRDVLWRKYQRNRIAHKDVEQIDSMIADREDEP